MAPSAWSAPQACCASPVFASDWDCSARRCSPSSVPLALRHATRTGGQAAPPAQVTSAPRVYLLALGATAPNPLTITSWAAVFAAASTARITHTSTAAVLLLAGIGLGTATWFTLLSTAMTLVRRLAARRVHHAITIISGLGLIAFGIILAWQTAAAASR